LKLFLLPRLRLRLLLPSIALIVAATMIPVGLRHPSLRYIANRFEAPDFLNNVLLYVPLGIALSGSTLLRTFLFGLCLSTAAEVLQMGYVDRVPSGLDITSNTCGALVGYLVAMVWLRATGFDPKSLRIPRLIAAAGIPLAILGAISLVDHPTKSDFSNWSPSFHLAIGNEPTGDRPWDGTISAFQIYPFAMAPSQIDALARQAAHADKPALPSGGLILPTNSPPGYGRSLLSSDEEVRFHDALVRQQQLTLLVFLQTNNVEQSGVARIITYSQDPGNRNFTLGQFHDTLTFRLRTPASDANGTNPALYSGPVLSLNHPAFVAAVYDGRISRLYVDGTLVAHADLGAKRPRLPRRIFAWLPREIPIREIELGASEALLSGLFALGIFALAGVPRRPSIRFFTGAAAGFAVGAVIWIFGISEPRLGVRILLECVGAGLVIAASVETELRGPVLRRPGSV
jgi:VanZ like protein/concanavalin A-like lectin/glucanase superfamily protein